MARTQQERKAETRSRLVDPPASARDTATLLLALLLGLDMQRGLDQSTVTDEVALTGMLALLGARPVDGALTNDREERR